MTPCTSHVRRARASERSLRDRQGFPGGARSRPPARRFLAEPLRLLTVSVSRVMHFDAARDFLLRWSDLPPPAPSELKHPRTPWKRKSSSAISSLLDPTSGLTSATISIVKKKTKQKTMAQISSDPQFWEGEAVFFFKILDYLSHFISLCKFSCVLCWTKVGKNK